MEETVIEGQAVSDEGGGVQAPPPQADPQVEDRARRQGWVPKEEFRGDPANWRPASEFVRRADEMMPILKATNRKLETKLVETEKRLAEIQGTVEKMVKIQSKYTTDQYENRVSELRAKKREAVQAGNVELYNALEEQERGLSRPEPIEPNPPAQTPQQNPDVHPEVAAWQDRNSSWYGADEELTEYSDIIAAKVHKAWSDQGRAYTPTQFLTEVERRVKTMFPTKFHNPNQRRMDVDEPGLRGGDNQNVSDGKKGWNDLPNEAKKQCNALIVQIPGYTKEKYLKEYFEGE